jgi:alkylation response protein AidB-like acyl-CoA dehydrogenase
MPTVYKAPVDDYVFIVHDLLSRDGEDLAAKDDVLSSSDTRALLEQAGRFFEEVWAPLDEVGDQEGCTFEDGSVTTPTGFKEGYRKLCEAGWNSVESDLEHLKASQAKVIAMAVREFAASSNNSLGLYSGLTNGATNTLERTGDDWIREHVVPLMRRGDWSGTMCLTEPHCGTDLRLMRTRAEPQSDGSFRITGTKIFISGGDHDLTENIIHLVLAKIPDDTGRLSNDLGQVNLFMVAKNTVDSASGTMGAPNGVVTGGMEKKMGLKGNATCTLNFEGAVGYRLGQTKISANGQPSNSAGMSGMFDMMNSARLGTGMQALASAQRAFTNSANYARERLAGRAGDPTQRGNGIADPIVVHPDVRRLLLKQSAFIEGARALAVWVRMLLDEADPARTRDSVAMGSLLTPVVKAFLTDRAFESVNDAMQIYGGHGYIRDNGIEQLVRDTRIFQLYEGANGVQAFDLVKRKLGSNDGKAFNGLRAVIAAQAAAARQVPELVGYADVLTTAAKDLYEAARMLEEGAQEEVNDLGAGSYDFLTMMGLVCCGFIWLKVSTYAASAAAEKHGNEFLARKRALAKYWFEREMPLVAALKTRISARSTGLMELPAEAF